MISEPEGAKPNSVRKTKAPFSTKSAPSGCYGGAANWEKWGSWDYVDFSEKFFRLPDSKTGAKVVHLGGPAIEHLMAAEWAKDNA